MKADIPYRILVVDDEPDVELLIRQKFRKKIKGGEYDFLFARDGAQALATLEGDAQINIVLSDINMPGMDGLTLLSRLSEMDRDLKTVIVSAYGDMPKIRTAMNRGAYDFLTKPIDFEDFELTIEKTALELAQSQEGRKAREQLVAIQQELRIAERIQQSILPRNFPPSNWFDLYAEMAAARSVGGDFFDFFELEGERLGIVIGDVSGKGVPAALFMAVCRTLLRATALKGLAPGVCLQYLNGILGGQTDPPMYVTLFYGILHIPTGEVEFSMGGHNPPFLVSPGGPARPIESAGGLMVGLFGNARFETEMLVLKQGDMLLLYTDGVTDAENPHRKAFGEDRLAATLNELMPCSAAEAVGGVIQAVNDFAASAPQGDDITVLSLRYLTQ